MKPTEAEEVFKKHIGGGNGGVVPFKDMIVLENINNDEPVWYTEHTDKKMQYILFARGTKEE